MSSLATALTGPRLPRLRGWRVQLGLFAAAYAAYSAARWIWIGDPQTAIGHAHGILARERELGADIEQGVQAALEGSALLWLLNQLYMAAQFVVLPAVLVWLYRRSRPRYRALRDTVLATWAISIPIHALFPVAPPRLAHIGLVDTITAQSGLLDSRLSTALYNPFAAVPSLHAGFALAVGVAACGAARGVPGRALALTWPALVALAVVATGNHFVFDIAAGLAVTAAGYLTARLLRGRAL